MPDSFEFGSAVFAAIVMFAPSLAARRAIAKPIPLLAPLMKRVFPDKLFIVKFIVHPKFLE